MKLRCTYREHGFQPLLENISTAKRVTVLTWSLEENRKSSLWLALRKLPVTSHLTIITNMPNRWKNYGVGQQDTMRRQWEAYWSNLNPENFECACKVYFCFDNHAKALVVDDIAYVGSANFTDASAKKFEAGVLLSEKSDIDELLAFIKLISDSSLPMLKAEASKEARPLLELMQGHLEIVLSIREDNGFILWDDEEWIEDPDWSPRESVRISEALTTFLTECRTAAEVLMKKCGGSQEILNADVLNEVIEFVRYFDDRRYNGSLPKPFDEAAEARSLTEEMLNECSLDGNVDDVMSHPEYSERLEAYKGAAENELNAAVIKAVNDLVERIETTVRKLRRSFGPKHVSREIDNTRMNNK